MLHYRAYLLDEHRHVISAANLYCADEQAAKERALQLVDANDVELWQLDRRIAVFKISSSPLLRILTWVMEDQCVPRMSQAETLEQMASKLWGVCYPAELQRPRLKPSRVHYFHIS